MSIRMDKRTHKSQFNYTGNNADDHTLSLTARDLEIFRLLDPEFRFHYLPSNWVHAFTSGDELRLSKRLARLARDPHKFLERRQDWYKHSVYSRTTRADRHLGERRVRDRDPFAHRLLQDLVQASIEIAVPADPLLRIVHWHELATSGKIPNPTIESAEPNSIALRSGKLIPDGKPFAIVSGGLWRFVLGKEIDRGTEPLVGAGARRSIRQKFTAYAECFEHRLYTTHYGFPNAVVLFVTTSEMRMKNMMQLCDDVIGPCSFLAFAHTKDWAIESRFPSPTGDLCGSFERVGHPPLQLTKF